MLKKISKIILALMASVDRNSDMISLKNQLINNSKLNSKGYLVLDMAATLNSVMNL